MLLLEGHISDFTCARYYFLYVEFSDVYVNQSLAGQTISVNDCQVPLAMKTCVPFNIINHLQENEAKIKLEHQNLTSQIFPMCLEIPLRAVVCICGFY
jgi:hypothetical protein